MSDNGAVLLAFLVIMLGVVLFSVGIRGRGEQFVKEVSK